jgi:conserved repeat domain
MVALGAHAQFRSYNIVYTDNAKGNIAMFGNTLMNIVDAGIVNDTKMNSNNGNGDGFYGNDNENMQYVDIDGSTGDGSGTINSSSSDLTLPAGSTIKFARLYWGGRVKDSDFDLNQTANTKIKIRKGTSGSYTEYFATQVDKNTFIQNSEPYTRYQAFTDITGFIETNGAGTYTVGNVPLSVGVIDNGGNYGGWCIVLVYENPSLNYNSIRLYDGFEQVFDNGNPLVTSVTLTGLNVPSGALTSGDANMGVVAWEGDANLQGDFLKINGNTFSNGINQSYNPWNGTISTNGIFVTTKNPDFTNQMGIDIDQFEVGTGYGILPNDTTATLEFGTEADQYFPGIISFVIRMKEPSITLTKSVTDNNHNQSAEVNEVLTYDLTGSNVGAGNANLVFLTDTLPSTVTYVPNSLQLVSSPGLTSGLKTDIAGDDVAEYVDNGGKKYIRFNLGTGANATTGGTLAPGETYEVRFKVTVNDPGAGNPVPAIINTARIVATSDANVIFVDDGTAIMNPEAGALPVTLINFKASLLPDHQANISWSTSLEMNCKYYDVQRSIDGNIFSTIATLPGNGTSSLEHDYTVKDELLGITSPVTYYRLSQVDADGRKNYSRIIVLRTAGKNRIAISPNPFSENINVNFDWKTDEPGSLVLINASGTKVFEKHVHLTRGSNYLKVENLLNLPSGYYFVQLVSDTEKISMKIAKQ